MNEQAWEPRDPQRIERVIELLRIVWNKPENHDIRLGQLLINCGAFPSADAFYVEDDIVERQLALAVVR